MWSMMKTDFSGNHSWYIQIQTLRCHKMDIFDENIEFVQLHCIENSMQIISNFDLLLTKLNKLFSMIEFQNVTVF